VGLQCGKLTRVSPTGSNGDSDILIAGSRIQSEVRKLLAGGNDVAVQLQVLELVEILGQCQGDIVVGRLAIQAGSHPGQFRERRVHCRLVAQIEPQVQCGVQLEVQVALQPLNIFQFAADGIDAGLELFDQVAVASFGRDRDCDAGAGAAGQLRAVG